jgi:alkylation response protein AidB-like acyl-CoA dehydrogenase
LRDRSQRMIQTLDLVAIPDGDEALREPVRRFLADRLKNMSATQRARGWMGFDAEFSRDLAERGWVGMTLPQAYGGGGRSQFARFVVAEELLAAGAPVAAHWVAERQCAPLILRYGSEEQRRFFIPKICSGEYFFSIGMSEPNSGSDLASVTTRARRDPDGWLLTGSKIWTTGGHKNRYMVAVVRTGEADTRQAGLSQMLIDLTLPGVTKRPIRDLCGDEHFAEVFFDDVRLPADALLGVEGQGWAQVTAELSFERSGPERIYSSMVLIDRWLDFLRAKGGWSDGEQALAGAMLARLATLRQMSLAVAALLDRGEAPIVPASIVKDLGTSWEQSIPGIISDHLASLEGVSIPADLLGALDYVAAFSPAFSLRGGTREVMRGIIARGLGLR